MRLTIFYLFVLFAGKRTYHHVCAPYLPIRKKSQNLIFWLAVCKLCMIVRSNNFLVNIAYLNIYYFEMNLISIQVYIIFSIIFFPIFTLINQINLEANSSVNVKIKINTNVG